MSTFRGGGRSGGSDRGGRYRDLLMLHLLADQLGPMVTAVYHQLTSEVYKRGICKQGAHKPPLAVPDLLLLCTSCRGYGRNTGRGRGKKPLNNGNYFGAKGQEMDKNPQEAGEGSKIKVHPSAPHSMAISTTQSASSICRSIWHTLVMLAKLLRVVLNIDASDASASMLTCF